MDTPITNFTKSQRQQTYTGKNNTVKCIKSLKRHNIPQKNFLGWPGIMRSVVVVRLFVDVKNGELIPRKSILKSRSRENSVCSDTSESSAADFEERRMIGRSFSHDEATHSDTSDGITEEDSPTAIPLHPANRFEVNNTWLSFSFLFTSSTDLSHVSLYSL